MSHRDLSNLQIPSTMPAEGIGRLCGATFVSEQVYRVRLPRGLSGNLMQLKGGELDGLMTTTVMGPQGIEGTAALEPVPNTSLDPLLMLRRLQLVSNCIEHLTNNLNKMQRSVQSRMAAEIEGSIDTMADICIRIDEVLLGDPSYMSVLLNDLRGVKRQLGINFEFELKELALDVATKSDELRRMSPVNGIAIISQFGKSNSFFILNLISICELLEIILQGSYSSSMIRASARSLQRAQLKVANEVRCYYDNVLGGLDFEDAERMRCEADGHWHKKKAEEYLGNKSKACRAFQALGESEEILNALLGGDSTREELEELWLSVKEGRLGISSEVSDLIPEKMIVQDRES